MKVELLYHTPLWVCAKAIRTCWASEDKSDSPELLKENFRLSSKALDILVGEKDKELIDRVGNKNQHSSVLRHLVYTFNISGVSTKTLLAFTRHKTGVDFSVQSTRFTTKKRKDKLDFTQTGNDEINSMLDDIMDIVQKAINKGYSNDDIAMLLPQAYQYTFVVTMNAQAVQHFLKLRTSKTAHYDIRELAYEIFEALPEEHKYLFKEFVNDSKQM